MATTPRRGFAAACQRLVARMEPGHWHLSREPELSVRFPADLRLNRHKPAGYSGWLQIRVLPPPPTSPWLITTFEVLANSKLFSAVC